MKKEKKDDLHNTKDDEVTIGLFWSVRKKKLTIQNKNLMKMNFEF